MRIVGRTVPLTYRVAAYVPVAILVAANIYASFIVLFYCSPIEKSWRPDLEGKCLSPTLLDMTGKVVSGE